jgi:hypothetical protein
MAAKRRPAVTEHEHQVWLFKLIRQSHGRWPELESAYAVPNAGGYTGGYSANGGRVSAMLAEGVEPGACDINLDVARRGFHGLRIELKSMTGTLKPAQKGWIERHIRNGYAAYCIKGYIAAWQRMLWYLKVDEAVIRSWSYPIDYRK